GDLSRGLEHLRPAVPADDFEDRVGVLEEMERGFARTHKGPAEAHHLALRGALRLMGSDKARAFDLSREPTASRRAYGESPFGQGCLLARRLVEQGVAFVEV